LAASKNSGRLNVNEVVIQEWANGKVEHEKFVY
jgi:hypothetical protein